MRLWISIPVIAVLTALGCSRMEPDHKSEDQKGNTIYREGKVPIALTKGNDPELVAAVEKARKTLPGFIRELENPGARQFFVKVGLPTPNDSVEHIWLESVIYRNSIFHGKIGNDPLNLPNYKFGDPVTVKPEKVEDWMIVDGEKTTGGFTSDVLQKRE